jgi:two-component system, NtrC family, nitrogen regulation response regulator GlnG
MIKIVKSVVIATDDPEVINQISGLLMKFDCSIIIEKSTIKSIIKVLEMNIDYIILDAGIPDHSTFDLVNIIRKTRPKLPIVVISSDSSFETLKELAQTGIYYCAFKPLQHKEIEQVIDSLFRESLDNGIKINLFKEKINRQKGDKKK